MILRSILPALQQIAPLELAEEWDNVGLLVGDPAADVRRVLLTIDLTDAVVAEAIEGRTEMVLCYHPPVFKPLSSIVSGSPAGDRVFRAIRSGLSLYAMHTALDAAGGGTNDALAEVLGLVEARPLAPWSSIERDSSRERRSAAGPARLKLITFVPEDAADRVADAVFAAGAGQIGQYSRCSFRVSGTGTFLGGEGTSPAVGQAGRFERVSEVRLEVELPAVRAADVITALRRSHPYETVAFDLLPLVDVDERVGLGRIGRVGQPATLPEMIARIKRGLNIDAVWVAAAPRPEGEVEICVAACCAGSCGELHRRALAGGAQLYLTGEFRHHDAIEAARAGMAVVAVRHSVSERLVLTRVAERLARLAPELSVRISAADADPFRWA